MSPKFNKTRELVRDWRRGDVEGLKNHLENINFEEIFQDKDANSAWIAFKGTIEDTISRYIPLSPRRKQGDPPWLSKSVKRLVNRKQRFWKRFSKNRNDANYERFKSAEKLCKKGVSVQSANLSGISRTVVKNDPSQLMLSLKRNLDQMLDH